MQPLPVVRPPDHTEDAGRVFGAAILLAVHMVHADGRPRERELDAIRAWAAERAASGMLPVDEAALDTAIAQRPSEDGVVRALKIVQAQADLTDREIALDLLVQAATAHRGVNRKELAFLMVVAESLGWSPARVAQRWGLKTALPERGREEGSSTRFYLVIGLSTFGFAIAALAVAVALLSWVRATPKPPAPPPVPILADVDASAPPIAPPPKIDALLDDATRRGRGFVECDIPVLGYSRPRLIVGDSATDGEIIGGKARFSVEPGSGSGTVDLLGHSQAPFTAFELSWADAEVGQKTPCTVTERPVARVDVEIKGWAINHDWSVEGCEWAGRRGPTPLPETGTSVFAIEPCKLRAHVRTLDGVDLDGPWETIRPVLGEAQRIILRAPRLPTR